MNDRLQSHFKLEGISLPELSPDEKEQIQMTPDSLFHEDTWVHYDEARLPSKVKFRGKFKDIVKELSFNDFSFCQENTHKGKAWNTIIDRVDQFRLVNIYLLEPNEIIIADIKHITYEQIKTAYEEAKKAPQTTHYEYLGRILVHWRKCTQLESISQEYQLNSSACKAIIDHKPKWVKFDKANGYKPFDVEQIEILWSDFNQRIQLGLENLHKKDCTLRSACLSAILFLSGMRIRELRFLKKRCCTETSNGNYELTLTRFKTAANKIVGEEEVIPTTKIVYDACRLLESFSDKYTFNNDSEFLIPKIANTGYTERGMDINNIRSDIKDYGNLIKITHCHPHRFRKTIAWLLISMDEENIALLRQLLGHKSYAMTVEYISRNPELVEGIKAIYKERYSDDLSQIIDTIFEGYYSGKGAERIAEALRGENAIKPQQRQQTIDEIITILIESGEPLFLQRTPIGIYCMTVPSVAGDPPPCVVGLPESERMLPKVRHCKWESCGGAICIPGKNSILESNIEHNLAFYNKQIKIENIDKKAKKECERLIKLNEAHLKNLRTDRHYQFKQKEA